MEDKVYALVKPKNKRKLRLIVKIFEIKGFDADILGKEVQIKSNPSLFEGYFSAPIECKSMQNSHSGVEARCYYLKKGQKLNLRKEIRSYVESIEVCGRCVPADD